MDPKAEQMRKQLQEQIVSLIKARVQSGSMDEDRNKAIAQMVLDKLPEGISYSELMKVVPTLDDHFQELAQVVVPIMVDYEKKIRAAVDDKIQQLMSEGKFDAAMQVANKAIEFEKGLA